MTPEEKARKEIDRQLEQCGCIVQDYRKMNISASREVAVREFPLTTGEMFYLLHADGKVKRDKINLDLFWLKDKSLEDSDDLPDPDVLAQEITDDLQTALDQFSSIVEGLKE